MDFHPLQFKEIEIEVAGRVRPAVHGFVGGKNLELLSLYGFDLITSLLEDLENKVPSLIKRSDSIRPSAVEQINPKN